MQVYQHVRHFPSTSCAPCVFFFTALHAAGFTLTYGQGCNIAQALVHIKTSLLRPTCTLLDHTPSIEEGTVDDADIFGDIESSLFRTQYHPQLVLPWVEVCIINTSQVMRH